jgi:hypothetical protein
MPNGVTQPALWDNPGGCTHWQIWDAARRSAGERPLVLVSLPLAVDLDLIHQRPQRVCGPHGEGRKRRGSIWVAPCWPDGVASVQRLGDEGGGPSVWVGLSRAHEHMLPGLDR